ncbi:aspartate/glutamate racemase family protein [Priestia taiwanensis]|uniref:Aspartate racemase n=1 Tax=Priestia taiwanensis TaxID=1347902 RepID=A0A917EQE6_9BACI|nr:amino acid racemase [Priestia taiwanensis]MBM7362918.1 aspartate racemase [Priestia taiwanensis]GGE66150.1 aspartate racemase [Priestia taiwanensis]
MIGILAGMGPMSTGPFIDKVMMQCQQLYGAMEDMDFPEVMIYSCPTPYYTNKPINHNDMEKAIIAGAKRLEKTGVDFIAMPCNTGHLYIHNIKQQLTIPILHIVEETMKAIPKEAKKVAVLATQTTVDSCLYDEYLQEVEHIQKNEWQVAINELLAMIKAGKIVEATRVWNSLYKELKATVDVCIVACTDLNVVIDVEAEKDFFVDSSTCLAQATVREYIVRNNVQVR